jgi:hypothetical protein
MYGSSRWVYYEFYTSHYSIETLPIKKKKDFFVAEFVGRNEFENDSCTDIIDETPE